MSLRTEIDLLQRLLATTDRLLRGAVLDADRDLALYAEALHDARSSPAAYRLVDDEATLLARTALRLHWARRDRDEIKVERWWRVVGVLHELVAGDVIAALKSEAATTETARAS